MLFGFALAVIVGNQLGPISILRLALLAGLWLISRATFLCAPQGIVAATANIAFAVLLATQLAPRLLAAAKKWRNQALPLVLTGICVSSIAFQLARQAGFAAAEHTMLNVAVLLFALLMLFMGGRLIAPLIAGQFYRQGGNLDARVQPRIEGGLIIAVATAVVASLFASWRAFALLAAAATAAPERCRRCACGAGGCGPCKPGPICSASPPVTAGLRSACSCTAPHSRRAVTRPPRCTSSRWGPSARSRSM
jgi:uncharacterized protein involved in response to NO